jgi:outer membrane protein assembly factor BamB
LYALDANTGQYVWQHQIAERIFGEMPTVANGMLYVACGYYATRVGALCALDAATGALLWEHGPEGYGFFLTPAVSNGVVYAAATVEVKNNDNYIVLNNLYALDAATGSLLWQSPLTPTVQQFQFAPTTPAVANGVVYIGSASFPYGMYAIDAHTGRHLWQFRTTAPVSSPAVANGVVYLSTQDGNLYAFDAGTGAVLWRYAIGEAIHGSNSYLSSPAVVNGMVYIAVPGWLNGIYAFHLPDQ